MNPVPRKILRKTKSRKFIFNVTIYHHLRPTFLCLLFPKLAVHKTIVISNVKIMNHNTKKQKLMYKNNKTRGKKCIVKKIEVIKYFDK